MAGLLSTLFSQTPDMQVSDPPREPGGDQQSQQVEADRAEQDHGSSEQAEVELHADVQAGVHADISYTETDSNGEQSGWSNGTDIEAGHQQDVALSPASLADESGSTAF